MIKNLTVVFSIIIISFAFKRSEQYLHKFSLYSSFQSSIFTSPKLDYTIDLGEKWKVTYIYSPDSSDIVISTHVIDINNMKMLRIYRNDGKKSKLKRLMKKEIHKLKRFTKYKKIHEVKKEINLEYDALSFEYEYNNGNDYIEKTFVMKSKNGNDYCFQTFVAKNEFQDKNMNELFDLLKTFKSK